MVKILLGILLFIVGGFFVVIASLVACALF